MTTETVLAAWRNRLPNNMYAWPGAPESFASEAVKTLGWQAMETAPKTDEFIGQDTDGRVFNCRWEADDCGENWYDVHGDQLAYPIRWMPLPAIKALSVSRPHHSGETP